MKARMQELIGLLTLVVERVGTANARAAQAESRVEQMRGLLDALTDENAALQAELDQAADTAAASAETIRLLREQVEADERLLEALEARAAEAELRIFRAADALGLPLAVEPNVTIAETPRPSALLH